MFLVSIDQPLDELIRQAKIGGLGGEFYSLPNEIIGPKVFAGHGTAAAVSIGFKLPLSATSDGTDLTTGFYPADTNQVGVAGGGSAVWVYNTADGNKSYLSVVPSASRTFNLGSAALEWASLFSQNATISGLTATQVVFAGVGGILTTDSGLVFTAASDKLFIGGELEIDGDLNHDGTNVGFYGIAPTPRPTGFTQTYSTSSRTHSNLTSATLTDNSGGTGSTTIAAITGGGANCENATKNAVASLAAQVNALRVDIENIKQVLNQVIDDHQLNGLLA